MVYTYLWYGMVLLISVILLQRKLLLLCFRWRAKYLQCILWHCNAKLWDALHVTWPSGHLISGELPVLFTKTCRHILALPFLHLTAEPSLLDSRYRTSQCRQRFCTRYEPVVSVTPLSYIGLLRWPCFHKYGMFLGHTNSTCGEVTRQGNSHNYVESMLILY